MKLSGPEIFLDRKTFILFIYLERLKQEEEQKGRERRGKESQADSMLCTEPDTGAQSPEAEIMT